MSAGAPAIPAPGPFSGSHAPPIGQLRVARRPNRPHSGPLRAFQPQGHTSGHPPETSETPVNAVSKRRWLRALRGVGAPRVLGPAVSQPSPGPAIEGTRDPSSRCCSAQFTGARLRAVGRVRACSDRSGSMSAGAPAIPAPGPFSGSHAPPIGQLRVARRPNRPHSGPLRAFQPRGHTSGHPPETSGTPVNAVSKRRWLRALRGVGAPRVLGPDVSQPSPGPAIEGTRDPSSRCCSAQFTGARLRAVGRVRACSDRSGSMSAGAPAIPAPGPFSGSHAPPIGQLRVARRPNRPHSGPLRAFQPQGHTPSTPLKPLSTPFPSAAGSARSTAPPRTSIQGGRSVDDMARHAPHRCRIDRNPTTVHSALGALGERLTYRLLQVQRSLSKEPQTSAVTCPPQPDNSASRDDQPRPRSLTTTSHPLVSRVLRHAGDLQHRSGEPAHQYRVHGAAEGSGRALFDGRSRSLSGQCVHQAAVAVLEVRSGLPAPVGGRLHGAAGDRRVVEFYNEVRPHSALDGRTPAAACRGVAAPGQQMA